MKLIRIRSTRMLRRFCHHCQNLRHFSSSAETAAKICVVGSGPAGYYTTLKLLGMNKNVEVDMYEKLPTPFGLVRYGVAPDHPEVKAVIKSFTTLSEGKRFRFVGNVNIGKDITVSELQKVYHAVVLAYGAHSDRKLGIPGEEHILSAPTVVGWYNGDFAQANLKLNLDIEEVVIIGHGNVALDISRILLMDIDTLRKTDITPYALEALSRSRIKKVHMIGRRGPLQAAFTIAELREMIELSGCEPVLNPDDFSTIIPIIKELPRPKKRMMQLLVDTSIKIEPKNKGPMSKQWNLKFCRSPLEVVKKDCRNMELKLGINTLEDTGSGVVAKSTGKSELQLCQMVIRSVGYLGLPIDAAIPFDKKQGIVLNNIGRVEGTRGLYCSGWIQTGPVGVLLSTRNASFDTAVVIDNDLKKNLIPTNEPRPGFQAIGDLLNKKGIQTISFQDWLKIDRVEKERGAKVGKPREKIVNIKEMLKIAGS